MSADIWSLGCVFIEMVAALKGYDVNWLRKYYTNIHSNSPSFHANPKATEQLLKEWDTSTEDLDRTPLDWIQGMLSVDRQKRPTAASVVDMIMSPDSSGNTMNFCGICCATDTTRYSVCSLSEDLPDIYETNEETTDFSSERLMAFTKSGSSGYSNDTGSTEAVGQSSGTEPDIRSLSVSTNSQHSEHITQQANLNPLSATESIAGILTTAAKLQGIIRTITSTGNAPNSLYLLPRELQEIEGVLLSLQVIFADLSSVSPNRTAMIQLDELIATLTDTVLAIDKLRHTITTLAASSSSALSNQAELTQAETSCMDHLERIQGLRRSLALILSVLQW
jgi:serine/threonine protein kinase